MIKHDRRIGANMARQGRDTAESIKWRAAHNAVLNIVARERASRQPITPENAAAELAWQETRIAELMRVFGYN